jgi:hypothetical protein
MTQKPKGVVAVMVGPDGREVCSVSHFGLDKPGGFELLEAQKHYAKVFLNGAVIRAMCSDDIAAVVRDYDAEQIVRALCEKKGYKVHMISIGHETE